MLRREREEEEKEGAVEYSPSSSLSSSSSSSEEDLFDQASLEESILLIRSRLQTRRRIASRFFEKQDDEVQVGFFRAVLFFSGAFAFGIFSDMVSLLILPFLRDKVHASDAINDMVWIGIPLVDLIFGFLFTAYLCRSELTREAQRRKYVTVMFGSCCGLILFLLSLAMLPYMDFLSQFGHAHLYTNMAAILFVGGLMVAMNGHVQAFFIISYGYGQEPVASGALPAWIALGQIAATMIVRKIGEPLEHVLTVFGIASGIILVSTLISLGSAYLKFGTIETHSSHEFRNSLGAINSVDKEFIRHTAKLMVDYFEESRYVMPLFIVICSASLYSFLAIATDWFEIISRHGSSGVSGHEAYTSSLTKARMFQHLAQLGGSILVILISMITRKLSSRKAKSTGDTHNWENMNDNCPMNNNAIDSQRNVNFYVSWFIAIVGIGVFTVSVFGVVLIVEPNFLFLAFAATGLGNVVVYSLRNFQNRFLRFIRVDLSKLGTQDEIELDKILHRRAYRDVAYYGHFNTALIVGQLAGLAFLHTTSESFDQHVFIFIGCMSSLGFLLLLVFPCLAKKSYDDVRGLPSKPGDDSFSD
jgi:hypothetical protein